MPLPDTESQALFFELPDPAKVGSALNGGGPSFPPPNLRKMPRGAKSRLIDSEHSKNLKSDGFRLFQLTKSRFPTHTPSRSSVRVLRRPYKVTATRPLMSYSVLWYELCR